MKLWTWLAAVIAVVVLALGVAYLNRATILAMVAHSRLPHVEPNRPVTFATGPAMPLTGDRPPNVIFILADDLGYNDITFNGGGVANGAVPTPNIDSHRPRRRQLRQRLRRQRHLRAVPRGDDDRPLRHPLRLRVHARARSPSSAWSAPNPSPARSTSRSSSRTG